jgi:hypothetical protein
MPIALKHDPELVYGVEDRPGRWRGVVQDDKRTAIMSCPKCSGIASLNEHEIAAQGQVSPSVVCPFRGCTFHDHVLLEGWGLV